MFELINRRMLDNAIDLGHRIRFSHNPLNYGDSFLVDEWKYLKETLPLRDSSLYFEEGYWYVR
jgi:hypothetical protein